MNDLAEKFDEMKQLAKIKDFWEKKKESDSNKAFIIGLGIVLGIVLITGTIVIMLTSIQKKNAKKCQYNGFYDEFNDEADIPVPDDLKRPETEKNEFEDELKESDFAE